LEIANLSEALDLYVQAGDVVNGGRQDRTLGVDFVLPAKSGRLPVPSFCVASGRWRETKSAASTGCSSLKGHSVPWLNLSDARGTHVTFPIEHVQRRVPERENLGTTCGFGQGSHDTESSFTISM